MSQTPNVQVPLVYLDAGRAGRITREWLPYLTQAANAAAAGDLTPLQAAIDSLQAEVNAVEAAIPGIQSVLVDLADQIEALPTDGRLIEALRSMLRRHEHRAPQEASDMLMFRSMSARAQQPQPDYQAILIQNTFGG